MTTEKVTNNKVLSEAQIAGMHAVVGAIAWKNKAKCHIHEWAMVVVVDHRHLDPVVMFVLGQQFEFHGIRPQAVQIVASNGETATAFVAQRQSPGIPLHELEHFMKLVIANA